MLPLYADDRQQRTESREERKDENKGKGINFVVPTRHDGGYFCGTKLVL